jgi:hypothetical protein
MSQQKKLQELVDQLGHQVPSPLGLPMPIARYFNTWKKRGMNLTARDPLPWFLKKKAADLQQLVAPQPTNPAGRRSLQLDGIASIVWTPAGWTCEL